MGSVNTKVTLLQQEEAPGEVLVRQAGEAVAVLQTLLQEIGDKAAVSDCGGASLPSGQAEVHLGITATSCP